jgi:hypothetical protein
MAESLRATLEMFQRLLDQELADDGEPLETT